jgi:hypothetical protein
LKVENDFLKKLEMMPVADWRGMIIEDSGIEEKYTIQLPLPYSIV